MQLIARQSARVARRTTSNAFAARQGFHTSAIRAGVPDPNLPLSGGNSDPQQNVSAENEEGSLATGSTTQAGTDAQRVESIANQKDPDHDDTKPSTATKVSKPRLTLRQRRLAESPKPPPIPEWFLDRNVFLLSGFYEDEFTKAEIKIKEHPLSGKQAINCRIKENNAVLFTVPPLDRPLYEPENIEGTSGKAPEVDLSKWLEPLMWILLEAELSIRAAFAIADTQQSSSSFASSRTDLSLVCPDEDSHYELDLLVKELALTTNADLMRIDANDLEDLTGDFVGDNRDTPSSFSTLAYDVFRDQSAMDWHITKKRERGKGEEERDMEEDGIDRDDRDDVEIDIDSTPGLPNTLKKLGIHPDTFRSLMQGLSMVPAGSVSIIPGWTDGHGQPEVAGAHSAPKDSVKWDEARLSALLDSLMDAAKEKRHGREKDVASKVPSPVLSGMATMAVISEYHHEMAYRRLLGSTGQSWGPGSQSAYQRFLHRPLDLLGRPQVSNYRTTIAEALFGQDKKLGQYFPQEYVSLVPVKAVDVQKQSATSPRGTIIHLRDLQDICRTPLGDKIIRRLVRVVQKRRRRGERIVIVGTSTKSGPDPWIEDNKDHPFRTLAVPPYFTLANKDLHRFLPLPWTSTLANPASPRIMDINVRHLQSMLRRMQPENKVPLTSFLSKAFMAHGGSRFLSEDVLAQDDVQRLVLLAIGLTETYAVSSVVYPVHIGLACFITSRIDQITRVWLEDNKKVKITKRPTKSPSKPQADAVATAAVDKKDAKQDNRDKVSEIRQSCSPHETRLLGGVVDAGNIKTGFDDVHVPLTTTEALKTLTELSLSRPSAFSYGVLAKDRLPGLLLYGPPGTGKTLLAKAVAKSSKSTVLEVSGAQLFEKYVGESEKMVRAVFSLARKLSPCVVFIDEADSILASRNDRHERHSHRAMINQFLREWDGMDDHGIFIMVATNRPFDLDDAVLRRLPRRLLVDLPVSADREKILAIHLDGEQLDSTVSLSHLAEQTSLYSGSDLKNVCVSAALAAVREENSLRDERRQQEPEWELPERRTLSARHFDQALAEISASISEDMVTLSAIRKFDEKYGDRKGRRQKTKYGFGESENFIDENSVRVRQGSPVAPAEVVALPAKDREMKEVEGRLDTGKK